MYHVGVSTVLNQFKLFETLGRTYAHLILLLLPQCFSSNHFLTITRTGDIYKRGVEIKNFESYNLLDSHGIVELKTANKICYY